METIILRGLITDEDYIRKVLPFLKEDYFHEEVDRILFKELIKYFVKYNSLPTKEAILIALNDKDNLTEVTFTKLVELTNYIFDNDEPLPNEDWMHDNTEKFCKDRAVYNAVMDSINIIEDDAGDKDRGSIPDILSKALAVSFDDNVGHDYMDDAESRYEYYHKTEERIEFDLDYFNKITGGGLPKKTLNVGIAGTGVGKSLFMCHCGAGNLMNGYNVLYISMEMSEERIAERIDANLFNTKIDELYSLNKGDYGRKIHKINQKTQGKLIIKEYPTGSANVNHFRHLVDELKIKKNFKPDIIYIDYLNICASARVKNSNANSYTIVKSIAEELRGFAVEQGVPIVTATQTTRGGYDNSDVSLTDTSESFGVPATADMMFALIQTEELEELNQIMIKQLKNRYKDPSYYKKFVIGVDKPKMKLYDLEDSAQDDIVDSGKSSNIKNVDTTTGEILGKKTFGRGFENDTANKFGGFKV